MMKTKNNLNKILYVLLLFTSIAWSQQYARPISDLSSPGTWNGDYTDIDETTSNDGDYGYSDNNTSGTYEVELGAVTDPQTGSGHVVRCRVSSAKLGIPNNNTGNASSLLIRLMSNDGTQTTIATVRANTSVGLWENVSYTLSAAEANSITDYSKLSIEFEYTGGGGLPDDRRGVAVSWLEFEVPNVTNRRIFNINKK